MTGEVGRLDVVAFRCLLCGHKWEGAPERVEAAPEREWHPWGYFAACPECDAPTEQAAWQRGLLKAWTNVTGPVTEAGKARSAANLDGHPTPQEALRTRFNGLKHGLYARHATYFPARPGGYPACEGCEYLEHKDCLDTGACLRRTELFLRHQVAFELQDPGLLQRLAADRQAALAGLIDDMILAIAQDGGPRIKDLSWYTDKDGVLHLAQWTDKDGHVHQIFELKEHPLLRTLILFIEKNRMTLGDLGMTPRVQEDADTVRGHLDGAERDRASLLEYQDRQASALEKLQGMIERSRRNTRDDPVLIEHQGGGDG